MVQNIAISLVGLNALQKRQFFSFYAYEVYTNIIPKEERFDRLFDYNRLRNC